MLRHLHVRQAGIILSKQASGSTRTPDDGLTSRWSAYLAGVAWILWIGFFHTLIVAGAIPARGVPIALASRPPPLLTKISQVRGLSQVQAPRLIPVKLHGVVTAFSGYKNSFFMEDRTAGISVDRTDSAQVRVGDEVEVTGTSGAGLFAPLVLASHVLVTGHGSPPAAPYVTYGDMFGGAQDSQWIEVKGVVHSAKLDSLFGHDALFLTVEIGGDLMKVILQDFRGIDSLRLIDSTLRIRGVCSSSFNAKRQFVGLGLFVPDRSDIDVLLPSPRDPFAMSAIPARDALQFGQGPHRVKVAGIATYQVPGQALYVQDGADGILIESPSKELVTLGSKVEAVGFPVMGNYSPALADSLFRVVGDATPIQPLRIQAKDVIIQGTTFDQALYDQQLVRLEGKVSETLVQAGQRVWILRHAGEVFHAQLPLSVDSSPLKDSDVLKKAVAGSVLSVTGICVVHADSDRKPISFNILMRSSQDIQVIQLAPWWTGARVTGLIAMLAAAIILVILWVVMLRHRVKQQTRAIRESEELFRKLAMHDGLTGLLNRSAILAAMDREMERCRRDNTPLTIVLADIDYFKQVNDTHGHLFGDKALQRFVEAISSSIRSFDQAGRYGGEEFLIVLTGISAATVEARIAAFHANISNLTVRDRDTESTITCSMGAIFFEPGQLLVDQHLALTLADRALYQAKAEGRNRVVFRRLQAELPEQMSWNPERQWQRGW